MCTDVAQLCPLAAEFYLSAQSHFISSVCKVLLAEGEPAFPPGLELACQREQPAGGAVSVKML